MENLEIKKGGRLVKTEWVFDEEAEQGSYKEKDVTDFSFRHLFDLCSLEDGVTLKDVFLLVSREAGLYDLIIGNWLKDYMSEAFNEKEKEPIQDQEIDFLELYWTPSLQKLEGRESLQGSAFPCLHGLGPVLQNEQDGFKAGSRIPYSLSFMPLGTLLDLPLKIKKDTELWSEDFDSRKLKDKKILDIKEWPMTLGQIVYGIFWELSFYGSPKDRDQQGQKLKEIIKDLNINK